MLYLRDGKAVFCSTAPESRYLSFCQSVLARRKRVEPFSKLLLCYFDQVLLTEHARSNELRIGFSFWDHDSDEELARLVVASGFDYTSLSYPKILKYGEGIVGSLLKDLNSEPNHPGYVSCDYRRDPHLAAANTVIEEFGYKAGLAFPVSIKGKLAGIFKLYCSAELDLSILDEINRLRLEGNRLSFLLSLAEAHFSSVLRAQLANHFRHVDSQLPTAPPAKLMGLLKDTVEKCLQETTRVVDSIGAAVILTKNHEVFKEVGSQSSLGDSFGMGLADFNDPSRPSIGYLEIRPKRDGTYFSLFDQNILAGIAQTFSKYLSMHLALAEEAETVQAQLTRQRELLHVVQKNSLELVNAKTREDIVEALLRGVNENFQFSDLIFLLFDGGKLKPYMSIPPTTVSRLNNEGIELGVLRTCVAKDSGWIFTEDCPSCCECDGLTSIAALQRAPLRISDINTSGIRKLYADFGVRAQSEFVIPLSIGKTIYGVLDLYRKNKGDIDDYEWFFLQSICNFASLAFYNRYLFDVLENIQREENRGEMARDVVHTLTPTTSSLITYAEHLQESLNSIYHRPGDDKATVKQQLAKTMEHFHGLVDSIRQQENLIHRYETASRKSIEDAGEISLDDLITNVITLNSFKATTKRIKFKRVLEGARHPIQALEMDVYLILWNLINNAVKFTRGTKPTTITIKEKYTYDAVVVSVRDEGVGIREEDRRHIWEPGFSTIAPGADRETSGIGLAAVHELTQAKGWDIKERSKLNSGSEFILTIPE